MHGNYIDVERLL